MSAKEDLSKLQKKYDAQIRAANLQPNETFEGDKWGTLVWVLIGLGIGAVVILIVSIGLCVWCCCCRKKKPNAGAHGQYGHRNYPAATTTLAPVPQQQYYQTQQPMYNNMNSYNNYNMGGLF